MLKSKNQIETNKYELEIEVSPSRQGSQKDDRDPVRRGSIL